MHIIKRELRANAKSLLIWSGVMIAMIFMMVSEFSAYYNNPEMADILDSMPEAMLKAFSMAGANLTTTTGFISLTTFYFYLMTGVFAVLLGNGIISKEERDKTAEFFLTMPVSREKVIFSKWIVGIINCILLTLVTGGGIVLAMMSYNLDKAFFEFLILLMGAMFFMEMIFLSIGMLLASILKRYKTSGKISAAILMVLYFINVLSALSKDLDFLKYVTPFKYFVSNELLLNNQYELKYLLLTLGIVTFSMIGTFIIYPKRDLHL